MNLRFLRTFVAIADHAGFARAAARLNLTQSAASRQIQALEDELGLRLFARIGRSARLTAEGRGPVGAQSPPVIRRRGNRSTRERPQEVERPECFGLAPPRR